MILARNRQTHAGRGRFRRALAHRTIQTSTNWRNGLATTEVTARRRGREGARERTTTLPQGRSPWGQQGMEDFLGTLDSRMRNVWALDAVPGGDPATMRACAQACRGGGRRGASVLDLRIGKGRSGSSVTGSSTTAMATFTGAQASNLGNFTSTAGAFSADRPA